MAFPCLPRLPAALHSLGRAPARHKGGRVVFLHIPKTAGSSVNRYFKRHLGSARSGGSVFFFDGMTARELAVAQARAERARFIGGHFGGRILAEIRRPDDLVFTFLREPAARLRSHYSYDRTHPDGTETARRLALAEYVASDETEALAATDNVMARQLAVAYDFAQSADMPLDAIAEAALGTLATLDFVGLVETIDDDLSALAGLCGLPPPPRAPRVNATSRGHAGAEDAAALRALAGPRLDADERVYRHVLALRAQMGQDRAERRQGAEPR
ncbi:MAG TPA: hypothetical protein VHD15_03220 [Hyphomicrobiales bacterium]|nr:hypothetical protein [Hyphomicrobiales bacterium]